MPGGATRRASAAVHQTRAYFPNTFAPARLSRSTTVLAGSVTSGTGMFAGASGTLADQGSIDPGTYSFTDVPLTGDIVAPAAVPEPASLMLIGLGVATLFGYTRWQRERAGGRGEGSVVLSRAGKADAFYEPAEVKPPV